MFKKTLAIVPFLVCQFVAYSNPDSLLAAQYLSRAAECLERARTDSARQLHQAALKLYEKNERLDLWLDSYIPLAYTQADVLKQPFEAKEYLNQALTQAWRQPRTPKEWEQWVRVQMNKGHLCQWYISDYTNAVKYYEESFQLFLSKLGEKNDRIASYIYHQLGNAYTRLGDYERAEKMLRRGIDYGKQNNNPEIGKYGDLAIVLVDLGKNVEALSIVNEGISLPDAPEDAIVTARLSEARAWFNLGNTSKSRGAMEKIPALIAKMKGSTQEIAYYKAGYFAFSATLQGSLGNAKRAEADYKKAIEFESVSQGSTHSRELGKAHCDLAYFYLSHKSERKALAEFQQGLQSVLPKFNPADISQNPAQSNFYAENTIVEGLLGKAQAFRALHQLENALACYELIPIVEAKLRATHAYESSSLLALKESRQRFHEAIDIAWQLFEQSNGNPQYAERAFRLTELARGMLLLQSLVQARQFLPDDIRQKDYELRVRMAWLEHEIAAERDKDSAPALADEKPTASKKADSQKISDWERQLFDLKLERQKLLSDFPAYNNPDSLFLQVLAAKDVRNLLRPGQAMADYFLTETAAYIFSFDATGDFRWRKAPLPAPFREQTKQFAAYLWAGEGAGRDQFLRHAWLLDSLLLAPERTRWGAAANSLIIVPDDLLILVPFEVLLSRPGSGGSTWRDQPWLLADHNFGYAYSATLLSVQKSICEEHAKSATKPRQIFGGFAPSYAQSSAYKLKNTRPMVQNVRKMLGGKAWFGTEASEERFKNSATDCRIFLLAMHGISDNEHPELSRLLFGDPGLDSLVNNNILYASELQIMRLQADLVVLSACHSGAGKLEQGEGVYSLSRAFAAARVPATLMSLWLLHENTARPLVEDFFKYLQQGKTKDEALRLAKLDFLKNDKNFEMTHPFFWAGLTAAGDMRALDLPAKPPFEWEWWWLLAAASVAALGWWQWKRRRKHSGR
ncbi:MAG: CHAT domain-containing protein [Saprospiraceae bacterium]